MKTAKAILDEVYVNGEYDIGKPSKKQILEAMKAYAKQVAEKVRQDCADNAKVSLLVGECKKDCEVIAQLTARVDSESILNGQIA